MAPLISIKFGDVIRNNAIKVHDIIISLLF